MTPVKMLNRELYTVPSLRIFLNNHEIRYDFQLDMSIAGYYTLVFNDSDMFVLGDAYLADNFPSLFIAPLGKYIYYIVENAEVGTVDNGSINNDVEALKAYILDVYTVYGISARII